MAFDDTSSTANAVPLVSLSGTASGASHPFGVRYCGSVLSRLLAQLALRKKEKPIARPTGVLYPGHQFTTAKPSRGRLGRPMVAPTISLPAEGGGFAVGKDGRSCVKRRQRW